MPKIQRRGHIVTVLNLKGGVGKTHAAWLLASVCEERNLRILLIDTDPQGNLSNSFARDRRDSPGVARLLDPSREPDILTLIRRSAYQNIDIVPSSSEIARFDLANQAEWEASDLHLSFRDPVRQMRALYDFIVFDCPPRLSLASFASLCASDAVIVPLEAADWGAQGIIQVTEAVHHVQRHYNRRLELLGYLVSRFRPRRTYQQTYLSSLREHFGDGVFDTVIPDLAGFERAVTDAIPPTRHAPRSTAAAIARTFFDEVTRRLETIASRGEGPIRLREDHRRAGAAPAQRDYVS